MANLTDTSTFDAGVYQLETTDPLLGGAGGVLNQATQNLANRTRYLKDYVDGLVAQTPIYAGVSLTNEQDIVLGDGSINKVLFDTVDFDDNDLWSTANKRFDAPAAGVFALSAHLNGIDVSSPLETDPFKFVLWVKKNGTIIRTGQGSPPGNVSFGVQASISCLIPVAAADYVEVFASIEGLVASGTFRIGQTDPQEYRNESNFVHVTFTAAVALPE